MDVRISDLKISLDFGIKVDVIQYEAGYQQDRYMRVKVLIKQLDRSRGEIHEVEFSMPAEYAKSMAHRILEETVEPPPELPSKVPS